MRMYIYIYIYTHICALVNTGLCCRVRAESLVYSVVYYLPDPMLCYDGLPLKVTLLLHLQRLSEFVACSFRYWACSLLCDNALRCMLSTIQHTRHRMLHNAYYLLHATHYMLRTICYELHARTY